MFDLERTGNLIEAGFWMIFGGALAVAGRKQRRLLRRLGHAASVISVLFGLSDLVEARTGAWWRPWWLLVWKAVCLMALTVCFLRYRQLRSGPGSSIEKLPQASSSSM